MNNKQLKSQVVGIAALLVRFTINANTFKATLAVLVGVAALFLADVSAHASTSTMGSKVAAISSTSDGSAQATPQSDFPVK